MFLADPLVPLVDAGFDHATTIGTLQAWISALAYTLQIYFDFSGYTDMALGAALIFNIRLPINFDSPYRSLDLRDFWHRWHMTLSRFLREYVYIPLGGNRAREIARARQPAAHVPAGRPVARRRVDVRVLGRAARAAACAACGCGAVGPPPAAVRSPGR